MYRMPHYACNCPDCVEYQNKLEEDKEAWIQEYIDSFIDESLKDKNLFEEVLSEALDNVDDVNRLRKFFTERSDLFGELIEGTLRKYAEAAFSTMINSY